MMALESWRLVSERVSEQGLEPAKWGGGVGGSLFISFRACV